MGNVRLAILAGLAYLPIVVIEYGEARETQIAPDNIQDSPTVFSICRPIGIAQCFDTCHRKATASLFFFFFPRSGLRTS